MKLSVLRNVLVCALTLLLPATVLAAGADKKANRYSQFDKAAYLTQEQLEFIRPGLQLTIDSITIAADTRRPRVVFSLRDDLGQPLDRDGIQTPGNVSTSWVLGRINAGDTQYTSYTNRTQRSPITGISAVQPSSDSGGTYRKVAEGVYEYTFGTALPPGYPTNVTTTLGVYSTRDLRPWGLTRHVANATHTFVPDGTAVRVVRDVSRTETCNQCHNPLEAHGGARRDLLLCNLCHVPGAIDPDTGNTIDMKVMVHKIHRGESLPSVQAGTPYQIVGFSQSLHDYSTVVFPQDARNCETCHKTATQADNWFLNPTRASCESCHDLVNWDSGVGHAGGRQISDRFCATCHFPEGELEFDASVKGAHTIPEKSRQLQRVNFEIVQVANALPGRNPRLDFRITNGRGEPINPAAMSRLAVTVAGPTTDYSYQVSENIRNPLNSGTVFSFDLGTPLPSNARGTFTFGMEGYINATLNPGTTKEMSVRDRADSIFRYVAVTDAAPVPRREVVSDAKCNACHEKLILHGGNRNFVQYCATCHNPVTTDVSRRPAAQLPAESVDFRTMIHKIHTGEELNRGYTAYGFGGTAHDYAEVRYPGDRRDCEQCHLPGTYNVPLPDGRLAVTTQRDFFTPTPPESAACLSCHDSRTAAAHAFVNIAAFGEACGACHGANADFAVAKSHAR